MEVAEEEVAAEEDDPTSHGIRAMSQMPVHLSFFQYVYLELFTNLRNLCTN